MLICVCSVRVLLCISVLDYMQLNRNDLMSVLRTTQSGIAYHYIIIKTRCAFDNIEFLFLANLGEVSRNENRMISKGSIVY